MPSCATALRKSAIDDGSASTTPAGSLVSGPGEAQKLVAPQPVGGNMWRFLPLLPLGASALATVDLSAYAREGNTTALAALDAALRDEGMVLIEGHGIPADVVADMGRTMATFFAQNIEVKRNFGDSRVYGPEGYTERGVEAVARSRGATDAPPDAVESFTFSTPPADRETLQGIDPELVAAGRRYWEEMSRFLQVLHNATEDLLGLRRGFMSEFYTPSTNVLRLARYPEVPMASDVFRYGEHTDYLTFTLLKVFDQAPGLQLRTRGGDLVDVLPTTDGIVVNAADLTEVWTNGRWRSAPHRVVPFPKVDDPTTSRERFAIAFFTGPDSDAVVQPIVQPGDVPRYDQVRAGDWLRHKLDPTSLECPIAS